MSLPSSARNHRHGQSAIRDVECDFLGQAGQVGSVSLAIFSSINHSVLYHGEQILGSGQNTSATGEARRRGRRNGTNYRCSGTDRARKPKLLYEVV
jgi:hypothetical protein